MKSEKKGTASFFSLTFHKSVLLPALLKKITYHTHRENLQFSSIPFEYTILTSLAIGCMIIGFINYETFVWLIVGIIGTCGFIIMLFSSFLSQRQSGHKPTWEDFRVIPFLFSLSAGMSLGLIMAGNVSGLGFLMKMAGAAVGLISGYLIGVPAGFWFQSLGWIAPTLEIIILLPLMIGCILLSLLITLQRNLN